MSEFKVGDVVAEKSTGSIGKVVKVYSDSDSIDVQFGDSPYLQGNSSTSHSHSRAFSLVPSLPDFEDESSVVALPTQTFAINVNGKIIAATTDDARAVAYEQIDGNFWIVGRQGEIGPTRYFWKPASSDDDNWFEYKSD